MKAPTSYVLFNTDTNEKRYFPDGDKDRNFYSKEEAVKYMAENNLDDDSWEIITSVKLHEMVMHALANRK